MLRLEPEAVVLADDKQYFITQPGSSVATSLIEGEAKDKKIGILHIREAPFVHQCMMSKALYYLIFTFLILRLGETDVIFGW